MQITGLVEDVIQSYLNLVGRAGALEIENNQLKELNKSLENIVKDLTAKLAANNVREPDKNLKKE